MFILTKEIYKKLQTYKKVHSKSKQVVPLKCYLKYICSQEMQYTFHENAYKIFLMMKQMFSIVSHFL